MNEHKEQLKVKIPRKLKLAGHWFAIVFEKNLAHRHGKYGHCDIGNLKICIEPDVPDSMKAETLIHELTHAISDQFIAPNAFSEDVVCEFATGVWIMLGDLGVTFDWSEIENEE